MCGRYFFDAETALEVEDELGLDSGLLSVSSGDVTPAMSPAVLLCFRLARTASVSLIVLAEDKDIAGKTGKPGFFVFEWLRGKGRF